MIKALWRYAEKKAPAIQEKQLLLKEGYGIEGDHHADGGDRQISLLTVAEKEWMQKQSGKQNLKWYLIVVQEQHAAPHHTS